MESPKKFRIKPGGEQFTPADFDESAAWSEYYDFEEIDLIASWGIDRNEAEQAFRRLDTGGAHARYTVLDLERLPFGNMRIFLKANFVHSTGIVINGYLMNADAFVIGLFLGDEVLSFSKHPDLLKLMMSNKQKAETFLGVSELFPLKYQTGFVDAAGAPITGEFSIGKQDPE
jgi:hypothetical protein